MNARIVVAATIAVVTVIVIFGVLFSFTLKPQSEPEPELVYEIDFTYSDIDTLKEILATKNIYMSSPTEITDYTVDQYCTFFDDENKQNFVKYCTTTAILDSNGKPLGNINLGGTYDDSTMALAILEVSPSLNSQGDDVDFVFKSMIEVLVCDCWDNLKPGGFESVEQWLDIAEERYAESGKKSLKSKINGLDGKQITLEISSSEKSFLWILTVVK